MECVVIIEIVRISTWTPGETIMWQGTAMPGIPKMYLKGCCHMMQRSYNREAAFLSESGCRNCFARLEDARQGCMLDVRPKGPDIFRTEFGVKPGRRVCVRCS